MEARGRLDLKSETLQTFLYRTVQELLFNLKIKSAPGQGSTFRIAVPDSEI